MYVYRPALHFLWKLFYIIYMLLPKHVWHCAVNLEGYILSADQMLETLFCSVHFAGHVLENVGTNFKERTT